MNIDDPNLPQLRAIAAALGDLCEEIVFVGGATAGLLLTDPAAESVRATVDVDAIVDAHTLTQFQRVEARVAARGFVRDIHSNVICRWRHKATDVPFDLMPVDATVVGFSNPWYAETVRTAMPIALGDGVTIRSIAAPAFVATKLAAFADRGADDILGSHDLEDVLNVVDGRPELAAELDAASNALERTVRKAIADVLRHPDFINGLPGLVSDTNRIDIVLQRLRDLTC